MRSTRSIALAASIAWLVGLAGCLVVANGEPPECKQTSDCNSGEVCDENICWGNPPPGPFAAVISPPSERADLVSFELGVLPEISGDGWLAEMTLPEAVSYGARIEAQCEASELCPADMLGAAITVTRPSMFLGGPGFRKVITVEPGEGAFEINAPATRPEDPPYIVTIVPNGREEMRAPSLAHVIPPLRVELRVPGSTGGNVVRLGGFDLNTLSGRITAPSGSVANYRVVALGRWDRKEPLAEVSTVALTGDAGAFSLKLSNALIDDVEIVARPIGAPLRPSLRLGGIAANANANNLVLPLPAASGEVVVAIGVDHSASTGEIRPVAGARVLLHGAFSPSSTTGVGLTVEGTTDDAGAVELRVLDQPLLAASYRLSIIPPANSQAAALFDQPFAIQSTRKILGTRLAIVGTVRDQHNEPVEEVSVTARPSLRFLWNLGPEPQAFLGSIPAATMVTSESGEFVLFVDHAFTDGTNENATDVWGDYDLTFEPTATSRSATLHQPDVDLPRVTGQDLHHVGDVMVPDAAHVRGHVFDSAELRLEGAEVKLYRVPTDLSLCLEAEYAPSACTIPAQMLGRGVSTDDGIVRLTLPH